MRKLPCPYAIPHIARFGDQYCKLLGPNSKWVCPFKSYEQRDNCRIMPNSHLKGGDIIDASFYYKE